MPAKTTTMHAGADSIIARPADTVRPPADELRPSHPHAHHWRIAEARGATSPGVCRTCGMERLFDNWEKEPDAASRALPNVAQRRSGHLN